MIKKFFAKPFLSAKEEVTNQASDKPVPEPSYQLAFLDQDFLLREELRPVRLQLELLKPELVQQELGIDATIVVFGSARIYCEEEAQERLTAARLALNADPTNTILLQRVRAAESLLEKSHYYDEARAFGRLVSEASTRESEKHYVVVTGGGPGIMEAANQGAHDIGAKSIGMGIVLPMEEKPNEYVTPELAFKFHYFALRKMHFLMRARALVAFPGGLGTLDELFETLTLMQTRKIHQVPVLLYGKKYWQRIINLPAMVEEGVISETDLDLIEYVDSPEEAWEAIVAFYERLSDEEV